MDTSSSSGPNGVTSKIQQELPINDLDESDGWQQEDEELWDEPVNDSNGHVEPPKTENDSVAELEQRLGHFELEIKDVKLELESKTQAYRELDNKNYELQSKNHELETQSQELLSKKQALEAKAEELQEKSGELETKTQKLLAREQELVSQTKALETANLELREKVQQLSANEQKLKVQIEELETLKEAVGNTADVQISEDSNDELSAPLEVDSEYVKKLEQELEEVKEERDDNKRQLEGFLSKISSMKTVFQNYKATQSELEEVRLEMEALQQEMELSKQEYESLSKTKAQLETQLEAKETENSVLAKTLEELKIQSADLNSECDRLSLQLATLRREYQSKEESAQDEKYALENEVGKLTKRLNEQKQAYIELELVQEELKMENKNTQSTIEELAQKLALKDSEIEHYTELARTLAEKGEAELNQLNELIAEKSLEIESLQQEVARLNTMSADHETTLKKKDEEISQLQEETAKIASLQEEIHSKQLIIGKLRHEAVILNEHLTKSMGMLKKQLSQSKNTVDRDLISNLFLNFVQLPRGDTKKFEALQLIGDLLEWDDSRKVQAGLTQAAGGKPRDEDGRPMRQGFISMWTDFLEKESSKSKPAQ